MPEDQLPVIRVGIADDHLMVRKGIMSMLDNSDRFSVVAEGSNGQELIDAIALLKQPPDVCLLDINMPVLNGYDTLKALKSKYTDMKYLVLSMLDHEYVIIKMLRLGANGFLLKEDDPADLKRAIETVYEKDFYHTDLVTGRLIAHVTKNTEDTKLILNDHELKFLELSCSEMTYKEIASIMKVSARSVENYRNTLFEKLNIKSRTGLVIYALKLGVGKLE